MNEYKWYDSSQPQTLQYGVIMLYLDAVFLLIFGGLSSGLVDLLAIGLFLAVCQVVGALGIANERKWGYALGVAGASLLVAYTVYRISQGNTSFLLNLIFDVAVVCLLLHPRSRDYRRIWFK